MQYHPLGKTGLLVSELCLGTMTFGGRGYWEVVGKQQQEEVNQLIKASIDAGINFIDTADAYSFGLSEELLGQSIKDLGLRRKDLILATKARIRMDEGPNNVGLSRHHILNSIDESLERMGTDYIDLYQIHGVDYITPLEETLQALNDAVRMGKIRYIGLCNLPAWMITKAVMLSRQHGWPQFVSAQMFYSLAARDLEREVIPACQDLGLGVLPWSPLAGGLLSGKFTRENQSPEGARRAQFDFPVVNKERAFEVIDALLAIAKERSVSAAQVALAWTRTQSGISSVIIGAKRMEQLEDNLASVDLELTEEEHRMLDEASALPPEYPGWMLEFQARDRFPQDPDEAAKNSVDTEAVEQ